MVAVATAFGVASSAQAAQQTIPLMGDGTPLTVRTPSNQANQSYSFGQIVDGGSGHLIPARFTFTVTPTGGSIMSHTSVKGGGNDGLREQTLTCTATFDDPRAPPPSWSRRFPPLTLTGVLLDGRAL